MCFLPLTGISISSTSMFEMTFVALSRSICVSFFYSSLTLRAVERQRSDASCGFERRGIEEQKAAATRTSESDHEAVAALQAHSRGNKHAAQYRHVSEPNQSHGNHHRGAGRPPMCSGVEVEICRGTHALCTHASGQCSTPYHRTLGSLPRA